MQREFSLKYLIKYRYQFLQFTFVWFLVKRNSFKKSNRFIFICKNKQCMLDILRYFFNYLFWCLSVSRFFCFIKQPIQTNHNLSRATLAKLEDVALKSACEIWCVQHKAYVAYTRVLRQGRYLTVAALYCFQIFELRAQILKMDI